MLSTAQTSDVTLLRPVATQGESVARCATSVPAALLITLVAALVRSALGGFACWASPDWCFTANGVRLSSSSALSESLGGEGEAQAAQWLINLSVGQPVKPGDRVLIVGDEERGARAALRTATLQRALSKRLGLQVTAVRNFPAEVEISRPGGAANSTAGGWLGRRLGGRGVVAGEYALVIAWLRAGRRAPTHDTLK
jgi:hypothetical protein